MDLRRGPLGTWHLWFDCGFSIHYQYRPYMRTWPDAAIALKRDLIGIWTSIGPFAIDIFWSRP